ncbi:CheF family chemotaxis protein [Salinarchaeum sp. IM2453]|uniref:CheF family chemotaxis protein n=1 Tax=Salinarchaeum sp. IM2453 TaxID=2862870 RepID=UPI001C83141D|nr:CheF family chemotaxis protein [Salinarchaeum sp. IM2453]QZA89556.1 CheF family chemotaxis protein [Salinarchaeum sp. IM2453]
MSREERKLLDTSGKFLQVVKNGRRREQAAWLPGRILISTQRIVLVSNEGKRTIPLSSISDIGGRYDVNQTIARVSDYTAIKFGERGKQVVLVNVPDDEVDIETSLHSALLNHRQMLVQHPAVEGGVVQSVEWVVGHLKVEPDTVNIALKDGTFIEIDLDDISEFSTTEQTVRDESRPVLKVSHTNQDGTSVETHISGDERRCSFLTSIFREGDERSQIGVDLEYSEQKVLMALHSGVSPFEIPEFVDMDADRVEEIYERLIELGVLEEIRKRREVKLTARGRKVASGAIESE